MVVVVVFLVVVVVSMLVFTAVMIFGAKTTSMAANPVLDKVGGSFPRHFYANRRILYASFRARSKVTVDGNGDAQKSDESQ